MDEVGVGRRRAGAMPYLYSWARGEMGAALCCCCLAGRLLRRGGCDEMGGLRGKVRLTARCRCGYGCCGRRGGSCA